MSKLWQFCSVLFFLITSSLALFGGQATATSIVLWGTFLLNAFVAVCFIFIGAAEVLK